jgi:hypothetical protein
MAIYFDFTNPSTFGTERFDICIDNALVGYAIKRPGAPGWFVKLNGSLVLDKAGKVRYFSSVTDIAAFIKAK